MKKFMVLFMADVPAEKQMKVSPEEMKKGMEPWFAWFDKVGSAVVDRGMPLGMGVRLEKAGESAVKAGVAGYSVMQAESMDEAKEMLKDHPHLKIVTGASIEVLEILPMPGM